MHVLGVVLALSLAATALADGGLGSDQGSTASESTFTVATVGELQDQLFSTANLDEDSLVQVYTDFNAMQSDFTAGTAVSIEGANTTTFASVLVMSNSSGDPTGADPLSPRTQLYYNCTSAPFIWNLLDDTNVVALVDFQSFLQDDTPPAPGRASSSSSGGSSASASSSSFPSDSSSSGSSSGNKAAGFRADNTVVATAILAIANCGIQRNYSAQQLLLGNAFFGDQFVNTTAYFRVVTSNKVEPAAGETGGCHIQLELARAGLQDIYPDCNIKFYSTDLGALLKSNAAESTETDFTGEEKKESTKERQRRLGASSFGFLKHPSCSYECGYSTEIDQCFGRVSGEWALFSCTMAMYAMNPSCDEECGDGTITMPNLPASQCYYCPLISSCRVYDCLRISESADTTPKALTWNLQSDATTVKNREVEIYSRGNCSDLTDLTSDCCRLTCLDCFANLTIASMFTDVDVNYFVDATVDAEMVIRGNTNITLKLFAPSGCTYESTRALLNLAVTIPMYTGLSLSVDVSYSAVARATIKPRESTAVFGVASKIDRASAGFKGIANKFHDVQISSQMHRHLKQAALDVTASLSLVPEVAVALTILKVASVGVRVKLEVYAELQATVVFPEPMPALSTTRYNPNSLYWLGDCRTPHFMTYDVSVGVKNIAINFPVTVFGATAFDPLFIVSPIRFSLISGCVASAYKTQVALSIGVNAIASWTNNRKLKLLASVIRLLNFTDIDKSSLELSEAFDFEGRLYLDLQVPPSMVDQYPSESVFTQECNKRIRTSAFSAQLSRAVGMQVAAACDAGSWGATCTQACPLGNCNGGTCDVFNGTMIDCWGCNRGYWGDMCTYSCTTSSTCIGLACDRDTGEPDSCESCSSGYWGYTACTRTCDISSTNCASVDAATCDKDTGELESCGGSCASGFTGDMCSTPITTAPPTAPPTSSPTTPTPVSVGTPSSSGGHIHSSLVDAAWGGVWLGLAVVGLT